MKEKIAHKEVLST